MLKLAALATTALVLLGAAPAFAGGGAVIEDCTDNGRIDGHYGQGDYANAINNIPTDVDEYTDCREVIRRAQLGARGAGKPATGGSTSSVTGVVGPASPRTPRQVAKRARERDRNRRRNRPARSNETIVQPGDPVRQTAATTSALPLPLVLTGIGVLVGGLGLAASSAPFARRLRRR